MEVWTIRELERIGVDSFGLKARLYDFFMALPEALGLRRLRRDALCGLRGRVLEVGVGVGKNLPLYPPTVECVVGVDPDPAMLKKAEQWAREVPLPLELVLAGAEGLPLEEGSFDAVVSTLVFCTVAEPGRAFEEVRRVLKGSGEFRLVEHAMMEQPSAVWLQERATPLWKPVSGGCHLDRDTLAGVRSAGFEVERVEKHWRGFGLTIFARKS